MVEIAAPGVCRFRAQRRLDIVVNRPLAQEAVLEKTKEKVDKKVTKKLEYDDLMQQS